MYHWTRCSLLRSRDRLDLGSDAATDSGQRPARCHRDHHDDRGWRSGQHLAQGREAVRVVRDRSRHELFGLPGGWAYHSTAHRCCSFGGCLLLCRSPRQMLPLRRSSVEGRESSVHRRGQPSPRCRCAWWQTWMGSRSMTRRAAERDGKRRPGEPHCPRREEPMYDPSAQPGRSRAC